MRALAFLIICVVGCSLASENVKLSKRTIEIREEDRSKLADALKQLEAADKSILDELPNIIFDLIVSIIGNSDVDLIELPDLEVSFEEGRLNGILKLTEGGVGGFSDISRNGDAEVNLFLLERRVNVKLPVYFEELSFSYRYFTRLNILGVGGIFTGSFLGVATTLDVDVSLVDMGMTLNDLSLDARRFIFRFQENPWTDWMINIMINIVAEFARQPILSAVEDVLRSILGIMFGIL